MTTSSATDGQERRHFLRHPIEIPIGVRPEYDKRQTVSKSADVSEGGLSFLWNRPIRKDTSLRITIPVKEKRFTVKGQVVYSEKDAGTGLFRTGVLFTDRSSAFTAKLAEETLEILEYRRTLSESEGRDVPEEEAARLWIKRYAATFAKFL